MKGTKFSRQIRKFTLRTIATMVTITLILSTVTVLGLVSFADSKEQMISFASDNISESNILLPVVNSTGLTGDQYLKLTFKANMITGKKPIVGALKVASQSTKYKLASYDANVENEDDGKAITDTQTAPDLYCKYDKATLSYTAVIKLNVGTKISGTNSDHNNVCGFITIGNTEYGGTTDKSLEFVFAKPCLKVLTYNSGTSSWVETGDNLLSTSTEIKSEELDFEKDYYTFATTAYSKTQITDSDIDTSLDSKVPMIMAPIGKISTVNKSLVSAIEYNDNLSTGHNYIYHEEEEPTTTSKGTKAYYTCDCTDCDSKRFLTKNQESEILNFGELEIPVATEKMIVVNKNSTVSNTVIPLALNKYISNLSNKEDIIGLGKNYEVYAKVSFKARMLSGNMPIIGVLAYDGATVKAFKDNAENEDNTNNSVSGTPDLYCSYNPSTLDYEAIIKIPLNTDNTDTDFALTIGNAEHTDDGFDTTDYDASFAFTNPSIVLLNKTDCTPIDSVNLVNPINSYNTKFTNDNDENIIFTDLKDLVEKAPIKDFSRDGEKNTVEKADIPSTFFASTHTFKGEPSVAPTEEKDGIRAYFHCVCGKSDCCFKDKKYLDKGYLEVTDEELKSGKLKMITVSKENNTNVFVPLDLREYVKPEHIIGGGTTGYYFVKLTFTARMLEGKKPIVSRIRGSKSELGSRSEPDYADNNDDTYDGIVTTQDGCSDSSNANKPGPDMYSYFDENTNKFTAILCLGNHDWATLPNGLHDAVLIGHSEHNGAGYKESDPSVSFSFANPEMYILNATTGEADTSTGNLLPLICDENLNFDREYKHDNNPCVASNHILSAPKNKWSIDGKKGNVTTSEITKDYFRVYKFVYHPQVAPTPTKNGSVAYYTCECGDASCPLNGKLYSDKGLTEIDESEITLTYSKMITVGKGANNNAFIPLDLSKFLKSDYKDSDGYSYLRLRFTARMLNGDKPIVSRVRGSSDLGGDYAFSEPDYVDNNDDIYDGMTDGKPDLYCSYNPETLTYSAIIKLGVGKSWSTVSNGVHDAILIGNAEHNGNSFTGETDSNISFAFCDPELYFINLKTGETDTSTGNLIAPICEETLNFATSYKHDANPCKLSNNIMSAPKNKWSIDGSKENVTADSIADDFFKYYNFVYHPQVAPTRTQDGNKAYYICECGDSSCKYNGKYYTDKGVTEITDIKLGKTKMITVGGGANNNIFIPLDLKQYVKSEYKDQSGYSYLRLRFTARMMEGKMPIVSRIRGSSDKGGDYSYSEPDYVDNNDNEYNGIENKNAEGTVTGPDLYCNFNEQTCQYTAIIRLGVGVTWSTISNGVHDAILIGNAEHNGVGYSSETDSSVSFSFCDPELYFVNAKTGETDTSTGNLIAPICDETVNLTKSYKHNDNPCKLENHILSAPKNMWSVDGTLADFKVETISENYFKYYNFVYHPQVNPTSKTTGTKAYYTCECGDSTCPYDGKYFADKGQTEIPSSDLVLGKTKMLLISENVPGKSTISNVYVPLNLKPFVKAEHKDASNNIYVRLTFNAKMLSGTNPIVSRIRGSSDLGSDGSYSEPSYADNDDHFYDGIENKNEAGTVKGPDLYSSYNPDTMRYTAIISLRAGQSWSTISNGVHDAILIGNAEHNGPGVSEKDYNASFVFSDPELYLLNASTGEVDESTGNLIAPICDETMNFGKTYEHTTDNPCKLENHILAAPKDMWSIDGNKGLVSTYETPDNYFNPAVDTRTVANFENANSDSIISTTANLNPSTRYKIDIDYNTVNGSKLKVGFKLLNTANEYISAEELGASIENMMDNVEGKHFSAVISLPKGNVLGTDGKNFKLTLGASGEKVQVANIMIRPVSISGKYDYNILPNGDFSFAPAGNVSDKALTFWNVENKTEAEKIVFTDIFDNEFINTTPIGAYVSGSTGVLSTKVSLEPNKNYVLRFGSKYNSDVKAKPYVELKTSSGTKADIGSFSNDVADTYNTVYKFKTPSDLASGENAVVGINFDSDEIDGVFSAFEIYELNSNGSDIGDNLVSDPFFRTAETVGESAWDTKGGLAVDYKPISIYEFKILKPNLLIFSGKNGYDSPLNEDKTGVVYGGEIEAYIENTATIQNGKTYIFSVNYKLANAGYQKKDKVGPQLLWNTASGFVAVDAQKTVSDDEYKETYIFTPNGISDGNDNFKFRFNVMGSMTSGYLANALLYEYDGNKAVGEQLMENGNFVTGDSSEWELSAKSGHFYNFTFSEYPENFFSKTDAVNPSMVIYRNPTDYAQFKQHLSLKPNTNYQIEYKDKTSSVKFADKTPYISLYQAEYSKKDGEYILKGDKRNVDSSSSPLPKSQITYQSEDGKTKIFHIDNDIRTTGDGNFFVFLVMRNGNAGYWGDVSLYELDGNNKKVGNNIILNGDFSLGLSAWELEKGATVRVVEQPKGFFDKDYNDAPTTMIYSNGSEKNKTYGNTFNLVPGTDYYFTGNYVNMNAQGVVPEVLYQNASGQYSVLESDLIYDPDRYYFEKKFTIPDDALVVDGVVKVKVQINNYNNGKGYITNLMLTEGNKYKNLFDEAGFVGQGKNYVKMPYDSNVFVFYYDDKSFDDGDWSGEKGLTASDVKGSVTDEFGDPIEGIKLILNPGNHIAKTDEMGEYSFKDLKPGDYTLSLVSPETGKIFECIKFSIGESKSIMIPRIIYTKSGDDIIYDGVDITDNGAVEITDAEMDKISTPKCILMFMLFDADGNKMKNIPLFVESNGYAFTNEKGVATFSNIKNFGKKRVYINLDDGTKYVFRTVDVIEGKGSKIKLVYDPDGNNILMYILIIIAAVLVLAAGTVTTIILVKKRKAKKAE